MLYAMIFTQLDRSAIKPHASKTITLRHSTCYLSHFSSSFRHLYKLKERRFHEQQDKVKSRHTNLPDPHIKISLNLHRVLWSAGCRADFQFLHLSRNWRLFPLKMWSNLPLHAAVEDWSCSKGRSWPCFFTAIFIGTVVRNYIVFCSCTFSARVEKLWGHVGKYSNCQVLWGFSGFAFSRTCTVINTRPQSGLLLWN